jgi:hypothetical protein
VELNTLNRELGEKAPANDLKELAALGIRGELVFAVPCLIIANPRLLGYYRLLLGFSQKEFYNKGKLGRFKRLEENGIIPSGVKSEIDDLCHSFCSRASELMAGLGIPNLSTSLIDDLILLTLGPQLRGSNNTQIGKLANEGVFELIRKIVGPAIVDRTSTRIELKNAADRKVIIAFSADPDIAITEEIPGGSRKIIAIEVKGGSDISNIWNRMGEAEKSHQSAKQRGFTEFWTIHNLIEIDEAKAKEKSPTTQRIYSIPDLLTAQGAAYEEFRNRIVSMVGIKLAQTD